MAINILRILVFIQICAQLNVQRKGRIRFFFFYTNVQSASNDCPNTFATVEDKEFHSSKLKIQYLLQGIDIRDDGI